MFIIHNIFCLFENASSEITAPQKCSSWPSEHQNPCPSHLEC